MTQDVAGTHAWFPRAGNRVLIVGLGVSGAAAAEALLRWGALVTVVDAAATPPVMARARALQASGARVELGAVDPALAGRADVVVTSPGVPQDDPLITVALAAGVPLWSEPELAWRLAAGRTRLIAVTGTNGKTTTCELLASCLGVPAAGNIGTPLVSLLAADDPPPLVVAELSSFQLRFVDALRASVAVLVNLAPDHLDWHGDATAYADAKARIWARQRPGDWTVLPEADPAVADLTRRLPPPAGVARFSTGPPADGSVGIADGAVVASRGGRLLDIVDVAALGVRGNHNLADVCAAVAAALCAGADVRSLAAPLIAYRPGRHRLETVGTVAGVTFVNDSKATNPHAAAAALRALGPSRRVVWIAGGLSKGLAFEGLRDDVRRHVRAAVTIGASGPQIAAMVRGLGLAVVEAGTLPRAVQAAAALAGDGDTVVLAPACASMDQFSDYAERGDVFTAAVAALERVRSPSSADSSSADTNSTDTRPADTPAGGSGGR